MIGYWLPVVFTLSLLGHGAVAQYWAPANLPIEVDIQLHQLYWDAETGTFCVVGRTNALGPNPGTDPKNGILRYQAATWDTLGLFNNDVNSVMQHGDTLWVSGGFSSVNGQFIPSGVAMWFDGDWHPDPQFVEWDHGCVYRKINGQVYAGGKFLDELGQTVEGVGVRQNGQWIQVGHLPPSISGGYHQIFDIIEYNSQLVVTGNINTQAGDDVFVLEGNDWVPLGGGLLGWNSYGKRLAVYQENLYLGGGLSVNEGDVGMGIIRWDGDQWHPLGSGLQIQPGNNGPYGGVEDMTVYNGELFVAGGFRYAGGIPARIARWDGSQWCSVGGGISQPPDFIFCIGFFQDTLYVNAAGDSLWMEEYNFVAKFVAPEYEDNCGLWVGVEEEEASSPTITLHPNPTTGLLHVELHGLRPRVLWVSDALGRVVLRQALPGTAHGTLPLDMSALSPGAYLVTVLDAEGMRHTQRVVRQ